MNVKNNRVRIFILLAMVNCFGVHPTLFASPAPAQSLQAFLDEINQMQFPIASSAKHQEFVQQADAYLDLPAMAQKALKEHWSGMTPDQQKKFMELFWKLIENIAYPRTKNFLKSQKITYQEPRKIVRGVELISFVRDQEAALDVPVVYHLYPENGKWKIYDVFLDGVSIAEDLQYQFDKVIQASQYSGLIETMQKRLADAEKNNQSAATA